MKSNATPFSAAIQRTLKRTVGDFLFPLVICSVLCAAMLIQVWIHQKAIALAYRISDMTSHNARLLAEKAQLELELASLKTPKSLITAAQIAHERHQPRSEQIIKMRLKERGNQ